MSILAFVLAVVVGLALLFVVVAAARRDRVARAGDKDFAWLSDGGASSFTGSSSGADCGAGSDGGGSCDGGGGGGD